MHKRSYGIIFFFHFLFKKALFEKCWCWWWWSFFSVIWFVRWKKSCTNNKEVILNNKRKMEDLCPFIIPIFLSKNSYSLLPLIFAFDLMIQFSFSCERIYHNKLWMLYQKKIMRLWLYEYISCELKGLSNLLWNILAHKLGSMK